MNPIRQHTRDTAIPHSRGSPGRERTLDRISAQGARIMEGDIFELDEERIRHNALRTAYMIFSYLMEG